MRLLLLCERSKDETQIDFSLTRDGGIEINGSLGGAAWAWHTQWPRRATGAVWVLQFKHDCDGHIRHLPDSVQVTLISH